MKFSFKLATATILLIGGAAWSVLHGVFSSGEERTWQFYGGVLTMAAGWLFAFRLHRVSGHRFWIIAIALRIILLPMEPGKCESSVAKTWLANRAMKSRSSDRNACPA
jgi:hypothetical protein